MMYEHKHLKRLNRVWIEDPIIFITTCTHKRKPLLAESWVAKILIEEWSDAKDRHGWAVGRYVIMPDHVHFFCGPMSGSDIKQLSDFMKQWKQWTSKRIIRESRIIGPPLQPPIWQAEFFDHILRSLENYSQKWDYVRENPVRAGLVKQANEWPWQGELYPL
jgi:putative transposase